MVAMQIKNTMRRFLRELEADRGTKSQLAQAYYEGGIIRLVGKIDQLTVPGPRRVAIMTIMITHLPAPDPIDLVWLVQNHPYFTRVRTVNICSTFRWVLPTLLAAA